VEVVLVVVHLEVVEDLVEEVHLKMWVEGLEVVVDLEVEDLEEVEHLRVLVERLKVLVGHCLKQR
jgi:hypothetical protein